MSMKSVFPAVLAGLIAGIGGALVVANVAPTAAPVSTSVQPSVHRTPPSNNVDMKHLQSVDARLHALSQRTQALEQRPEAPVRTSDKGLEPESPSNSFVTDADRKARYEDAVVRWNTELATFEQEPVDDAWAARTSAEMARDVTAMNPKVEFQFVSAQCRTTTCAVKVRYPTHGDAVAGFGELLHSGTSQNCQRSTRLPLPAPEDEDKPYEVVLLHDCTEQRADG